MHEDTTIETCIATGYEIRNNVQLVSHHRLKTIVHHIDSTLISNTSERLQWNLAEQTLIMAVRCWYYILIESVWHNTILHKMRSNV